PCPHSRNPRIQIREPLLFLLRGEPRGGGILVLTGLGCRLTRLGRLHDAGNVRSRSLFRNRLLVDDLVTVRVTIKRHHGYVELVQWVARTGTTHTDELGHTLPLIGSEVISNWVTANHNGDGPSSSRSAACPVMNSTGHNLRPGTT